MRRFCRSPKVLLVMICFVEQFAYAGEIAVSTAEEFLDLPRSSQIDHLVSVFERRLEHSQNLSCDVEVSTFVYENRNGRPGRLKEETPFRKFKTWLLHDSYRVDTLMFEIKRKDLIVNSVSSGYDAVNGVTRAAQRPTSHGIPAGRIDAVHDPIVRDNRYLYWLRGGHPDEEEALFTNLLRYRDEFEIAPDADGNLRLTVPYQPSWATESGGRRTFILDPRKAFLPIRGDSRWDRSSPELKEWRTEKFLVERSELVGDVWLPSLIREEITSSSAPEVLEAHTIEASHFSQGNVTPADLVVSFDAGMKIVDATNGVWYTADANGLPADKEHPLYGTSAFSLSTNTTAGAIWKRRLALAANIAIVLALLIAIIVGKKWYRHIGWTPR
jgi:hypothetical protein